MRRRNRKDLKKRVVQVRKVRLDESSSGIYISCRGKIRPGNVGARQLQSISPGRGWFFLGEISPESTSNLRPSEMFSLKQKVT